MRNIKHFMSLSFLVVIGGSFFFLGAMGMNIEQLDAGTSSQIFCLNDGADLPVWEEGNFWEYDISILYDSDVVAVDISIENILFEIKDVTSESYNFVFHGGISGSIDLASIVGGNLIDTVIDGNVEIRASDLAVKKVKNKKISVWFLISLFVLVRHHTIFHLS